ncbi:uncharacterized protein [Zea mays]|uniref:uncharacterized protein n=1 Tax=Zea mays TaxID=4577 RepID=UPI0004DE95EC|nr:uncharacterized protein LOC103644999 [Zea mays]|eukprot:XP_008666357.1 uncharacterized protein LOC103644999 [Zea mays]
MVYESRRSKRHQEDDEIDDDLDHIMVFMLGEYRKRKSEDERKKRRGSVFGHEVYDRSRGEHDLKLFNDYFAEHPTYPEKYFRQRFRMSRPLFMRIAEAVKQHDHYFAQKRNAVGALGFSCLQKVTAAFRQLAYGVPADYVDEYLRIGESTSIESLRKFVRAVCEVFGPEYLRPPYESDTARLLAIGEQCGFPGMIGEAPTVNYTINGHNYDKGYYLADGIYPNWSTFVKTIKAPANLKDKNYSAAQESQRKDVERAFGVLQARFAIVRGPARFWDKATLTDIMNSCIIMHNMIIEDERDKCRLEAPYDKGDAETRGWISHEGTSNFSSFVDKHKEIRDPHIHNQLQRDLVEHLWERQGQRTRPQ